MIFWVTWTLGAIVIAALLAVSLPNLPRPITRRAAIHVGALAALLVAWLAMPWVPLADVAAVVALIVVGACAHEAGRAA